MQVGVQMDTTCNIQQYWENIQQYWELFSAGSTPWDKGEGVAVIQTFEWGGGGALKKNFFRPSGRSLG